ncbi:MAG: methylmalonyl Co-A mutase-associated GTPase MeaB [Schleiferiaceae bacterium]
MNGPTWTPEEWAEGIRRADRAFLGRALSLVESTLPDDAERASALFAALGSPPNSTFRLGLTGNPGAGKSTLTEALGLRWADQGHRVAVLAVDPSSSLHRGSILGDKTRMERLSRHPNAFIRPVASAGQLGGVAPSTRAAIELLELAGYTKIIVETVGVGQNETDAANYVDGLLLLALPNAGDDVQGIKRGIMERADLVAVNKCDGSFSDAGRRTATQLRESLKWFSREDGWTVPVAQISATESLGLDALEADLDRYERWVRGTGAFDGRRGEQREQAWRAAWLQALTQWADQQPQLQKIYASARAATESGRRPEAAIAAAFRKAQP